MPYHFKRYTDDIFVGVAVFYRHGKKWKKIRHWHSNLFKDCYLAQEGKWLFAHMVCGEREHEEVMHVYTCTWMAFSSVTFCFVY